MTAVSLEPGGHVQVWIGRDRRTGKVKHLGNLTGTLVIVLDSDEPESNADQKELGHDG